MNKECNSDDPPPLINPSLSDERPTSTSWSRDELDAFNKASGRPPLTDEEWGRYVELETFQGNRIEVYRRGVSSFGGCGPNPSLIPRFDSDDETEPPPLWADEQDDSEDEQDHAGYDCLPTPYERDDDLYDPPFDDDELDVPVTPKQS